MNYIYLKVFVLLISTLFIGSYEFDSIDGWSSDGYLTSDDQQNTEENRAAYKTEKKEAKTKVAIDCTKPDLRVVVRHATVKSRIE